MRKTGKRFGKQGEAAGSESKISVEVGTEEAVFDKTKMATPFFKKETRVAESTAKQEPAPKQEDSWKIEKQSVPP